MFNEVNDIHELSAQKYSRKRSILSIASTKESREMLAEIQLVMMLRQFIQMLKLQQMTISDDVEQKIVSILGLCFGMQL